MAIEVFMMNPPKRHFKLGASRRRRKVRSRRSVPALKTVGRRYRGYSRSSSRLWSKLRRARSKFRKNAAFDVIDMAHGGYAPSLATGYDPHVAAGAAFASKPKRKRSKPTGAAAKYAKSRVSGTGKPRRRKSAKKGRKTMAKRKRGWKGSKSAHRTAYWIGRARKSRKTRRGIRSFLKRHKISLKRLYGYRRRHRKTYGKRKAMFIGKYRGMRVAANRRRRARKNPGMAWNKLVKQYTKKYGGRVGLKKASRKYRRGRRRYAKNRELYQIAPVAANRGRKFRRNRALYEIPSGFAANPMTAALAFPKAVLNVGFITKNVLPMAAGAIGSGLVGGLVTKYILKGPQYTNAPWKKAALTAAGGVLGGLGIGLATKGRKADWAYKFAAGGMLVACVQLFDAYLKRSLGLSGMGIGESSLGYGSDDLKRRIAEELKTELDGVGGFMSQEDLDATGVSSIGVNAVSGFVTSEDLPSEGSSVSIDEFSAAPVM